MGDQAQAVCGPAGVIGQHVDRHRSVERGIGGIIDRRWQIPQNFDGDGAFRPGRVGKEAGRKDPRAGIVALGSIVHRQHGQGIGPCRQTVRGDGDLPVGINLELAGRIRGGGGRGGARADQIAVDLRGKAKHIAPVGRGGQRIADRCSQACGLKHLSCPGRGQDWRVIRFCLGHPAHQVGQGRGIGIAVQTQFQPIGGEYRGRLVAFVHRVDIGIHRGNGQMAGQAGGRGRDLAFEMCPEIGAGITCGQRIGIGAGLTARSVVQTDDGDVQAVGQCLCAVGDLIADGDICEFIVVQGLEPGRVDGHRCALNRDGRAVDCTGCSRRALCDGHRCILNAQRIAIRVADLVRSQQVFGKGCSLFVDADQIDRGDDGGVVDGGDPDRHAGL